MEPLVQLVFPTVEELQPSSRIMDEKQCDIPKPSCRPYGKHKNKQTNIVWEYRCPVSGCVYDSNSERSFANFNYLKQHYKKVHATKCHICVKCSKGFASSSTLESHKTVCGVIFICDCGISYSTREALQTHARRKGHSVSAMYSTKTRAATSEQRVDTVSTRNNLPQFPINCQPMVVVVNHFLGSSGATVLSEAEVTTSAANKNEPLPPSRPCFILPKSAPLHLVPLPTVAAMALSELSSRTPHRTGTTSDYTNNASTQTDDSGRRSIGCSPLKRSLIDGNASSRHHANRRSTKRSAETQTAATRKQRRTSGRCCGTQTRVRKSVAGSVASRKTTAEKSSSSSAVIAGPAVAPTTDGHPHNELSSLEEASTQTLALYRDMIDSMTGETPSGGDWSLSDMGFTGGGGGVVGGSDCHSSAAVAMLGLEVDINFAPVSSATQTSPRVRLQQRQQGLLSSLRGFLTSMGEAEERLSADRATASDDFPRRCQLSSHTQTDYELDRLLLAGGGAGVGSDESDEEAVGGILSCTDIHTQTTEDLQNIPYEQLLSSHMETQTSAEDALFFSELSGLCDIQTQTNLCDYGDRGDEHHNHQHTVADIHTQTPHFDDLLPPSTLFWRAPDQEASSAQSMQTQPTRTNHTETQTFHSLVDMCYDSSLTDSHTQTPGDWSDDVLNARLLF